MALIVGTNSYVTVIEADAYFLTRYGADNWAIMTEANKEAALVTGTNLLDKFCQWEGYKTDPDQDLEHPRNGDTETPQDIKNAQCELSLNVISSGGPEATIEGDLTELKAGSVGLKWNTSTRSSNSIYNGTVKGFLSPFCDDCVSNDSASVKVVRT